MANRTLKLEYCETQDITGVRKEYAGMKHSAYQWFAKGLNQKEIRPLMARRFGKTTFDPDTGEILSEYTPNSWVMQSAITEAQGQYRAHRAQFTTGQRKHPVVWGTRGRLEKLNEPGITTEERTRRKAEWTEARIGSIWIAGEACKGSNRLFDFDLANLTVWYKPNKNTKIPFCLKNLGKNQLQMLQQLDGEIGTKPITIRIDKTHIHLSYDFGSKPKQKVKRILGIDLNPGSIGIAVLDHDGKTIIDSTIYEISPGVRQDAAKRQHELIEILHSVVRKACHYQADLAIEKLSIGPQDHGKGRNFNRMVNNQWNRKLVVELLEKLCDQWGIILQQVDPQYSSTIGNLVFDLPDPSSAAAEIARRAQSGLLFPPFSLAFVPTVSRRNGLTGESALPIRLDEWKDWKTTHRLLKKAKLRYRGRLDEYRANRLSFSSIKSGIHQIHVSILTH